MFTSYNNPTGPSFYKWKAKTRPVKGSIQVKVGFVLCENNLLQESLGGSPCIFPSSSLPSRLSGFAFPCLRIAAGLFEGSGFSCICICFLYFFQLKSWLVSWRGKGGGECLWGEPAWKGKSQQNKDETWSHGEACPAHYNDPVESKVSKGEGPWNDSKQKAMAFLPQHRFTSWSRLLG